MLNLCFGGDEAESAWRMSSPHRIRKPSNASLPLLRSVCLRAVDSTQSAAAWRGACVASTRNCMPWRCRMQPSILDMEATKPTSHGCETVTFRLQPHPHAPARPLGQEPPAVNCHVMLALELMLKRTEASSTFIFDEVDAGIGGQTATGGRCPPKRLQAASCQVIVDPSRPGGCTVTSTW